MSHAPIQPDQSGKSETGDIDKFTDFMRRLVAVPHSEIKDRIEARKQALKAASPVRSASPKQAD